MSLTAHRSVSVCPSPKNYPKKHQTPKQQCVGIVQVMGSTDIAHLKAKGLIPRADGTKRKSPQYELLELDENFFENIMKFLSDKGFIEKVPKHSMTLLEGF